MSRRPKIKDIASRLGVSPATVSRALADTGQVAEPTLSRIREVAAALDYRPNVAARNLRIQRSMAVLLVVRDIGNPFYLEIVKGVEATAREAGYSVLVGNTENDAERETDYFDMLRDGHADGMILITGKLPAREAGRSGRDLFIVVALEILEGSGFPHVQVDNAAGAAMAVEHLISLGHSRIAHIAGPLPEIMAAHRLEGYRAAMGQGGLEVPAGYVQRGDYLLHTGQKLCRVLMELPNPPTAIFAANDEMAYGAIHELRRMGRDVPGDVSVAGFDDLYLSEAFFPPLTTVSQPRVEIGRAAMSILLSKLQGEAVPQAPVIMPVTLKIRGSTAPLRH